MATLLLCLLIVGLLGLSALAAAMADGLLSLSLFDLRERSQRGEQQARLLYPLRARGNELLVVLIVLGVAANVAMVLLVNAVLPGASFWSGFLAFVIATALLVMVAELLPQAVWRQSALTVATRLSPWMNRALDELRPLTWPVARWLNRHLGLVGSPKIHSRAELIKVLEEHEASEDSDIEADTVSIVRSALSFGDKLIRDVMTPRTMMVAIEDTQVLSPPVLSDLHKSGHSRFPVFHESLDKIVGTLYLHELVELKKDKVTAAQAMSKAVYYINDSDKLDHALNGFLKTKHHLFVVVNDFQETVGLLTIEDIIEQAIGRRIVGEFDRYEDLRAVAERQATQRPHGSDATKEENSG